MYQFGFKKGHSTGLCTNILKHTVNYYSSRGSHVFLCFVDFSKAFDKVNYWKLLNMLLDDGISSTLVGLLSFWFSHQEMCVKWNGVVSGCFSVGNGTRQGGVLSPYFFSRYIRGLLQSISASHIGCYIGCMPVNILAYADDIVMLSPSWRGLQTLIDNMLLCAQSIDMACNARKTVCMVVNPQCRSKMVSTSFPLFTLESSQLQFVSSFRYLGHIITNTLSDKEDIQREIKSMFFRTNILIRKFSHCSFTVKCSLFRSYCLSLYDIGLWRMFTVSYMNKLRSCYNKCIKSFFGYHRSSSMTQALLQTGLPSFDTILHNGACVFSCMWHTSQNSLVQYFITVDID